MKNSEAEAKSLFYKQFQKWHCPFWCSLNINQKPPQKLIQTFYLQINKPYTVSFEKLP